MKACKRGHLGGRYKNGRCKECAAMRDRTSELAKAAESARAMSPAQRLWARAKSRAQQRGIPFTITPADVVLPARCPALGVEFILYGTRGGNRARRPSLDRIIPSLGYVPGNVAVISHLANCIKNAGEPEQVRAVALWLESAYPSWLLTR